jgi:LDH2 family malate/lactate/ureidoglycolate dehydrogenase
MNANGSLLIPADALRDWSARIFATVAVPAEDCRTASDVLVSADLRGVDTHGIIRLPHYIKRIQSGIINAQPSLTIERDGAASALVDGDFGMGMVVGVWAMRAAIERARAYGMSVVGVRSSTHFGAADYYARLASGANMIGMSFTNTGPSMAPWGSKTPLIGTNPLAFAAPGGIEGGITMDMATSQVAWGKLMLAARAGKKIPFGWATDKDGTPTDDPATGMDGLMLPLGGYKGYGLALLVEILCATLTGADYGPHLNEGRGVGHFFIAIDIARFVPLAEFQARLNLMVDEIHACARAPGVERLYVPGEIELETETRRNREGIPLPMDVVSDLAALGKQQNEPFPFAA